MENELTAEQENFLLEEGMERHYQLKEKKKEEDKEQIECDGCHKMFDKEDLDLIPITDDTKSFVSENLWLCRECEEQWEGCKE